MKFKIPKFLLKKTLGNKGGEKKQMTIDEIKQLIQNGEKIDVEFKESKNSLTKDVFERYALSIIEMADIFYLV